MGDQPDGPVVEGAGAPTVIPATQVWLPSAVVVVFLCASAVNQVVTSRIVVSAGLAPEVPIALLTAVVVAGALMHLLAWYCTVLAIQWGARISSLWQANDLRLAMRTTGIAHVPLAFWALGSAVGLHYSLGNQPLTEMAEVMPKAVRYIGLAKSGAYIVSFCVLADQISRVANGNWRRVGLTLSPIGGLVFVLWLVTRLVR